MLRHRWSSCVDAAARIATEYMRLTTGQMYRAEAESLRHFANLLTGLRLLLAVPIVLLVRAGSEPALACAAILFAIAALTDLLDGQVARRWGRVTVLGAFLDPLADKCVIDGCIIALVLRSAFPPALAAIFLGRDLAVTAMRLRGKGGRERLTPGRLAKLKTLVLYAGLCGLLAGRAAGTAITRSAWLLIVLAAILSLVTATEYLKRLSSGLRLSLSFLLYLLFPRPGPLLSLGKIAFFLIGSFIAVSAAVSLGSIRTWLLVFVFYELVVSQGKYLINDLVGRGSDDLFLRGTWNRCPRTRCGITLVAVYAAARIAAGVIALLIVAGWTAALLGMTTVLLQVLYESLKLTGFRGRGGWLFLIVSANYGVRTLAGMGAVNDAAPLSSMGLLSFLWGGGLGALFLSIYWQRQGEYYLTRGQLSPTFLARYKPGLVMVYQRELHAARCGGSGLSQRLLQAMTVGGVLFIAAANGESGTLRGAAALSYLCWALLALVAVRPATTHSGKRQLVTAVATLASGGAAIAVGLLIGTACALPFVLVAIAALAYLLFSGSAMRSLVVHGAAQSNPAAA